MNRNFILGCLTGIIGGMLGTWMILFVDVKITLRESPVVLNINTGYNPVGVKEISIPSSEDSEDSEDEEGEDLFGILVNPHLLEALIQEFKEEGSVNLELVSDDTSIHVVAFPQN